MINSQINGARKLLDGWLVLEDVSSPAHDYWTNGRSGEMSFRFSVFEQFTFFGNSWKFGRWGQKNSRN